MFSFRSMSVYVTFCIIKSAVEFSGKYIEILITIIIKFRTMIHFRSYRNEMQALVNIKIKL